MYRWLGERYLNRIGGYETLIESRRHSLDFLPPAELLQWKVPPAIASERIPAAMAMVSSRGECLHTLVIRNKKYGKAILRQLGIFPDTFVQMGIQLAGFRLWGRAVPTYESGHTRMFVQGRTETIRTVTNEVKAWLEATRNEPDKVVFEKLKQAMARHKELSIAALTGQGALLVDQ